MADTKGGLPVVAVKRECTADDPSFVEEELQIFAKKPKMMWKNPRKKAANQKTGDPVFKTDADGLDSVPKDEPGCSYTAADSPKPEEDFNGPKKPKLNYRQLAFLAMKNANYIPMQTPQICDFVEHVFPFYAQGDEKSKIHWRNALSGAVRTGKCDEGLFTTNSVYGSGLRMFYGMRKDRIEQMDFQVSKWKGQFSEKSILLSGVNSLEELNALCNGTKGIDCAIKDMGDHVEKWKKSQLSGATLEDYDEKERQLMAKQQDNDSDDLTLTRDEEKLLARKAKKNAVIDCPVCDIKMNSKSFGRHMKLIHHLTQEDLLRHRLEMQNQKMDKLAGEEEKPIVCPGCRKHLISSVMLEAHAKSCEDYIVDSIKRADNDPEEDEQGDSFANYKVEDDDKSYDDIVLL